MKIIKKSGLGRTYLALIILAAVLVALIGTYFIVTAFTKDEGGDTEIPPELWEGESTYLGYPVAYPRLEERDFSYIRVINSNGSFELTRPDENGAFWLTYRDGAGEEYKLYSPPILGAEGGLSYESLYAMEQNDGYGRIYMLTYLCNALGTTYFTERIPLPAGDTDEEKRERELLLEEYGLDAAQAEYVAFFYSERNEDGDIIGEKTHLVTIGDRALSGSGYYFMADERDCIYYTTANSFEYATMGFHAYVKGMLVAAGIKDDSSYEPYLTTDFKQWVLKEHSKEGERVTAGSEVICHLNAIERMDNSATFEPSVILPEFIKYREDDGNITVDLSAAKGHPAYERIVAALVGRENGIYYNPTEGDKLSDRILITLLTDHEKTNAMDIVFGDAESRKYNYLITSVDSVITASGETSAEGTPCADALMLKVTYTYSVDGGEMTERQAVIDLSAGLLPEDKRAALRAASVGRLDTPLDIEVNYTRDSADSSVRKMIVSEIVAIFDKDGKLAEKVDGECEVSIRYYTVIDGVTGETSRERFNLAAIGEDNAWYPLKEALIGKKCGKNLKLQVYNDTFYREIFRDFTTLAIDRVVGFVESEIVASFRFVNASERDPFFGGAFFENTIENKYRVYGLNQGACEAVVRALGGIESNSNSSDGLMGETVAVGLTHKNMKDNELYAYKIYFELPRGIYDVSESDDPESDDMLSDFDWYSNLGFTLYISEEDPATGMRLVGSDMYDLVALVDGSKLEFLKQSFTELYARKDLILLDVADVSDLKLEFNMQDVYGKYDFELSRPTMYAGYVNGEYTLSSTYFEGAVETEKFYVTASEGDGSMKTALGDYLAELGRDEVAISALYNKVYGGGKDVFAGNKKELLGSSYFLEAFEELQLTRYQGILSAEEQAEGRKNGRLVMKMQVRLDSDTPNARSCYYTYEFYRLDDRRIMVSIYEDYGSWKTTPVSDFYISVFSFKQIVNSFVSLLNAEEFDGDIPYPDEVPSDSE